MRASLSVTAGVLSVVVAGLLLAAAPSAQSDRAIEVSRNHFAANRGAYGLNDPGSDLRVRSAHSDSRGLSHVRFDQYYRGLRVFEGEAIAHVDANGDVTVTNSLHGNLNLDPTRASTATPRLPPRCARSARLAPTSCATHRWSYLPRGERSIVDRVAWQVAIDVDNDFEDRAEWQYFIDARTGDVAFSYNGLETADYIPGGTAKTMYSGPQSIHVDQTAPTTFYLRDLSQGGGNFTCDMRSGRVNCYYITGSTPTFGIGSVTTSGPTAAADAHFGLQATWDYYKRRSAETASMAPTGRPTRASTTAATTRTPSGATPASA